MSWHWRQARSISRWPRASVKYSRHSESFSGTTRFIPRYSTVGMLFGPPHPALSPSAGERGKSVVEDQGGAGRRHGPSEVHRDAGVPHLSAPPRSVVIAVLALGPPRAGVVDLAAELADVLDHHRHAMGVALAEMAARGVVGTAAAQLDDAARDIGPALALLAEAVLLELQHGGEREGVVGARDVHLLGRDPGLAEDDVPRVVA